MEWLTGPSMSTFLDWVIKTTLLASVMTLLIFVIKAVLNNRVKPGWHYALWLLLMLRLLIPSGPHSEFSIDNLFSWTHATPASEANTPDLTSGNEPMPSSPSPEVPGIVHPETLGNVTGADLNHTGRAWDVKQVLTGIWLLVSIALLLRLLLVNVHFSMRLRKVAEPAVRADMQVLMRAKQTMGIKRRIRLSFSTAVATPTLFGLFWPHLIMPVSSRELNEEQLNHIYLHELAHVKHADILVNWLMHVLLALHWFNPLLWYALYKMREDQELAADALALSRIDPKRVSEYGHTIIALLEKYKQRGAQIPGTAGLSGSKQQLRRRIFMIKNFKRKSLGWTIAGLALIVALSGCALTNGKTTSDETAAKPPADATTPAETTTNTPGDNNSGDAQSGNTATENDAQNGSAGSGGVSTSTKGGSNQGSTGSTGSKQTGTQSSDTKGHEQQLKDIVALAKKGKVKGADFVAGKTTIDVVHEAWGEPDRPWQPTDRYAYDSYSPGAGRGTYAFGIGRGEVVYDIRYFGSPMDESQAFNGISFAEIKRTLGKPSSIKTNSGDDILMYKLGEYELKFVGPHKTQRLDHISVYSPRAAAPMGGSAK
ncbi:M56 family metallopeptidase [Paenibacillus sp. VCA1]|uniref:M56 family metallopeptidase n=1 Tax=Paenibacillus sp. VCA1 TaxID=3039148 RepID=UPI0028729B74|nr:M56 family metallopeptidase [Paenibacillus sp. VCA1]MDR9857413.1 M56 family metallopeptidase [Paenibacillus sp. VCA1]